MSIHILCPSCKAKVRGPKQALGRKGKCPNCGDTFIVKAIEQPEGVPARQQVGGRTAAASLAVVSPQFDADFFGGIEGSACRQKDNVPDDKVLKIRQPGQTWLLVMFGSLLLLIVGVIGSMFATGIIRVNMGGGDDRKNADNRAEEPNEIRVGHNKESDDQELPKNQAVGVGGKVPNAPVPEADPAPEVKQEAIAAAAARKAQEEAKEKQEAAKKLADAQAEAARKLVDNQKQAAIKLLDTRKAELMRAKRVAEEVIPRAEQARAKADNAAENVEKDSRIYNSIRVSPNNAAIFGSAEARQRIQDSQNGMQASLQLARSRQIAKEADAQAKQYEKEARQAVKDVNEAKASLRRAEEAAIRFGI